MFQVTYWELLIAITVVWVIIRVIVALRNGGVSWGREAQLIMVYICIIVVARIVYFPWSHIDGAIGPMVFDASQAIPPWVNLVPLVHLFDAVDSWQLNLYGNIALFIPVGIVWPLCFKELDSFGKTVLSGFCFSLLIELTQLPFYQRCSDVDDLILNTAGMIIGAAIFFICKWLISRKKRKAAARYASSRPTYARTAGGPSRKPTSRSSQGRHSYR